MEHNKSNPNPNSNRQFNNVEINCDTVIVPAPAQRLDNSLPQPSTFFDYRTMLVLKWIFALLVICPMLFLIPRNQGESDQLPRELTILLWNDEKPASMWNLCQWRCKIIANPNVSRTIDAVIVNADRPYTLKGIDQIEHSPNYLLVYSASKPLSQVQHPLQKDDNVSFNYTMTYRRDSDLVLRQYYFSKLDSMHEPVEDFMSPEEFMLKEPTEMLKRRLAVKKNLTMYIEQENYDYTLFQRTFLSQLRKYIDVETISSLHEQNNISSYLFMLIFEPTACRDYVHPHVYLALSNFIVPVLIGGTNLHEHLPPHSYIDGSRLVHPHVMANFLVKVANYMYEQYFWWHGKYQLHQIKQPYCTLCDQLRRKRKHRKPDSFQRWWRKHECSDRIQRHKGPL